VVAYRYYYYFSRDSCGEYENVRGRSQLSLQSRCCTRGMTRGDRPHPVRRTQLFVILASKINSHEATMRRAYNDERIHAHLDVPLSREESREYDLEIVRHKAEKGARLGSNSPHLTSPRLAVTSLRVFVCPDQCRPYAGAARPHYMQRTVIASRRRATPNPMDPLFSFRFNAPTLLLTPCYRDHLFSLFLFHFSRVFLISSVSPLSPKLTTLFFFLHFLQARERHFDISTFSRRRVRPRERTAVTSAILLF